MMLMMMMMMMMMINSYFIKQPLIYQQKKLKQHTPKSCSNIFMQGQYFLIHLKHIRVPNTLMNNDALSRNTKPLTLANNHAGFPHQRLSALHVWRCRVAGENLAGYDCIDEHVHYASHGFDV